MGTLLELVTEIVSSHALSSPMNSEELIQEIHKVHAVLGALEAGKQEPPPKEMKPALSVRRAFKNDEVICMICGKGEMRALTRHLTIAHGMKPQEYRKQFGIPRSQSLTAKSFSESRRQMAHDRGLAEVLVKARETRAAKMKGKKDTAKSTKTK